MRITLGIALATALMSAGSASAQIVDMRKATCNDFISFKRDTTFAIAMWLDAYYLDNETRTHLGLGKDAPLGRHIERSGTIVTTPILSGFHHRYARI
jgi:HdeA/HdeB family